MTGKLNFLVVVMISVIFALIVNAAEEVNGTYNQSNNNSSYDATTSELNENSANENADVAIMEENLITSQAPSDNSLTANNPVQTAVIENKETGKSVTASFGVYLIIVG